MNRPGFAVIREDNYTWETPFVELDTLGTDDADKIEPSTHSPASTPNSFASDAGDLDDDGEPPDEAVAACVQLGLSRSPLRPVLTEPPRPPPMLVSAFGMQLHAAVDRGRSRS